MRTIAHAQFIAECRAQGVPREDIAFRCPACGTVQSGRDLVRVGAGKDFDDVQQYLAFSCFGRWTNAGDKGIAEHSAGRPWSMGCNWTLGGLLRIHKLEVAFENSVRMCFELATPEEAQARAKDHA